MDITRDIIKTKMVIVGTERIGLNNNVVILKYCSKTEIIRGWIKYTPKQHFDKIISFLLR